MTSRAKLCCHNDEIMHYDVIDYKVIDDYIVIMHYDVIDSEKSIHLIK